MVEGKTSLDLEANPYELLGLGQGGAELSEADIKKAYRKKALALHPDKRPAVERSGGFAITAVSLFALSTLRPPHAAAEKDFNELQKAYDILWCVGLCRRRYVHPP